MEFEVVVKMPTENKWCISWAYQYRNTTIRLQNPVDFVHRNITREYNFMAEHNGNVYSPKYLESERSTLWKLDGVGLVDNRPCTD